MNAIGDTEAKLKDIILKKYKHLSVFCKKIDMPWTTLNSMLTRGIMNSSFTNTVKVATELNLDPEKLSKGVIAERASSESEKLSSEDIDFLITYHLLDDYGKAAVDETMMREKKRCAEMGTLNVRKLLEP